MPEWLDRARDGAERAAVLAEVDRRIRSDLKGATVWLRDLFFQPETDTVTRREVGARIGKTRQTQLFNLIFGHFLLGGDPDRIALIMALGEFSQPSTVPTLIERWEEADYLERLALIEALERMMIPQSLEFLSQVFNGGRDIPNADPEQVRKLRKACGDALSRHMTF